MSIIVNGETAIVSHNAGVVPLFQESLHNVLSFHLLSAGKNSLLLFAILCCLPWLLINIEFQYYNMNYNF